MSRRYSFQDHLENVVAKCGTFWLVLTRDDSAFPQCLIVPNSCKSNYCPSCRKANLRILRHRLYTSLRHHRWRLLTLTLPNHRITPAESLQRVAKAWRKFSRRWQETYPDAHWVRTLEIHRSGIAHLHLAVSRYVPVAWIKLHWHRAGGGFVKIVSLKDTRRFLKCNALKSQRPSYRKAAEYLTEELEKHTQDPHRLGEVLYNSRLRIFTTSRSIQLSKPRSPWTFYRISHDPDEAYYWKQLWEYTGWHPVGIHKGTFTTLVGVGIKDHLPPFEESEITQTTHKQNLQQTNHSSIITPNQTL